MTIFIHIGFGKTGTSAIQNFLWVNKERLLQNYKLDYPDIGLGAENHAHLADYEKESVFDDDVRLVYEKLISYLQKINTNSIILSSEYFCFVNYSYVESIKQILTPFGSEFKIIFYVRSQPELIESTFMEWVKNGFDYCGDVKSFWRAHKDSFDFMMRISPWAKVFGADSIIARVYDKRLIGDDVRKDFIGLLGIDGRGFVFDHQRHNLSINPAFFDLIREFDESSPSRERRKRFIEGLLDRSAKIPKSDGACLINHELKRKIFEHYRESNISFASSYLDESQKNIFYEEVW